MNWLWVRCDFKYLCLKVGSWCVWKEIIQIHTYARTNYFRNYAQKIVVKNFLNLDFVILVLFIMSSPWNPDTFFISINYRTNPQKSFWREFIFVQQLPLFFLFFVVFTQDGGLTRNGECLEDVLNDNPVLIPIAAGDLAVVHLFPTQ